ncbi:hypothetical protein LIA77_05870 [Sarocladium implicatum]|nr:hypothetical protein LIA77_05870 [Sarocladium implicatum]
MQTSLHQDRTKAGELYHKWCSITMISPEGCSLGPIKMWRVVMSPGLSETVAGVGCGLLRIVSGDAMSGNGFRLKHTLICWNCPNFTFLLPRHRVSNMPWGIGLTQTPCGKAMRRRV